MQLDNYAQDYANDVEFAGLQESSEQNEETLSELLMKDMRLPENCPEPVPPHNRVEQVAENNEKPVSTPEQSKQRLDEVEQAVIRALFGPIADAPKTGKVLANELNKEVMQKLASGSLQVHDLTKEAILKLALPVGGAELNRANNVATREALELIQKMQDTGWKLTLKVAEEGVRIGMVAAKSERAISLSAVMGMVEAECHAEFGTKKAEMALAKGIASGLKEGGLNGAGKAWNNPGDIFDIARKTQREIILDFSKEATKGAVQALNDLGKAAKGTTEKLAETADKIGKEGNGALKKGQQSLERLEKSAERTAEDLAKLAAEKEALAQKELADLQKRLADELASKREQAKSTFRNGLNWARKQAN
ncbi:MAG: hypothetical protein K2W95_26190 [Candidatus Obscuribacterales bacterium]|nr:hypothetical protein [Candidatus Obscuribacterales bacterium]